MCSHAAAPLKKVEIYAGAISPLEYNNKGFKDNTGEYESPCSKPIHDSVTIIVRYVEYDMKTFKYHFVKSKQLGWRLNEQFCVPKCDIKEMEYRNIIGSHIKYASYISH